MLSKAVYSAILASGELAEWSFWISATNPGDDLLVANAFQASLAASSTWKALFSSGVTFRPALVSLVDQPTGRVISSVAGGGGVYVGTGLASSLPPQCSVVCTLRTALAGRSVTGRMYLPGPIPSDMTNTGRFATASQGLFNNALVGSFVTAKAAASGAQIVVYSRLHRTIQTVTAVDTGDVIDTQRRRRDKLLESRVTATI